MDGKNGDDSESEASRIEEVAAQTREIAENRAPSEPPSKGPGSKSGKK